MENEVNMYVRVYHDSSNNGVIAAKSVEFNKIDGLTVHTPNGGSAVYRSGDFYVMSLYGNTIAEYKIRE